MQTEPRHVSDAEPPGAPIAAQLLRKGVVSADEMLRLLADRRRQTACFRDRLRARGLVQEQDLLDAQAKTWGLKVIDLTGVFPDPRLIDALGAATCLRLGLVPLRRAGCVTLVAVSRPEEFGRLRPNLEKQLGPVCAALATERQVTTAVHTARGPALARAAEMRVPLADSCRSWPRLSRSPRLMLALGLALALALWQPMGFGLAVLALALLSLALSVGLKFAAMIAALRPPLPTPVATGDSLDPTVSLIVALYREGDIAGRLVKRLARLDYPADLLDVILAVEEHDQTTLAALSMAELPPWMRVVIVPAGRVKTKPRALNHALGHARGAIVGVYDAEDAPEPDQIRKVVSRFQRSAPEVACLQGILDYYNPRTNWLSRCFTIEYAGWFRLILPGVARLGLVVPLGGTTLFFRRSVLEELGAWDAHNVTEDADLGVRLSRFGYRTELIDTVTGEEANCRAIPWVKQRSRWIKGYMMTWAVHMRRPALLWRQLGPRAFVGFQVMFFGSIAQVLLAPLLWSFMLVPLGFQHPLLAALPGSVIVAMMSVFVLSEVANLAIGIVGLRRSGQSLSAWWVPTMKLYFPLATLSAYKALVELVSRPFYWDKTEHGVFDTLTEPKR